MAFVRRKGNQIAIVHGTRDSETGQVVQSTLFTFFSKAEAYQAVGRGGKEHSAHFRQTLENNHPGIKFNWQAIDKGIAENMEMLPDLSEHRDQRIAANFRTALHSLVHELVQADPQKMRAASEFLLEHKEQLEFLCDVIELKLGSIDAEDHERRGDREFYWQQSRNSWNMNSDVEEMAAEAYRTGDYKAALAAFTLLTESFPNYAEGHNYLGLIYLQDGDLNRAVSHFRRTVELGRKLFPKRMRKEHYWSDHKTRPYMRGLRNLALALTRKGDYDEAIAICDTLENECRDNTTACCYRAAIYLNSGRWVPAEDNAIRVLDISPTEGIIAAFSQFEQGKLLEARQSFIFAAFNCPLGIDIVVSGRIRKPRNFMESEDYNSAIELRDVIAPYLARRNSKAKRFFAGILTHPDVQKSRDEAVTCTINHSAGRDGSLHRTNFTRWHKIRSMAFAKEVAASLI